MKISRIGDQRRRVKVLMQTTTKKTGVNFFIFIEAISHVIVGILYAIKGVLKNNRAAAEENAFYLLLIGLLIDSIKLTIRHMVCQIIKWEEQNPYLYELTYGKESSDLITDSHRLRVSHFVNAGFIVYPVMSIVMFFHQNLSFRINPTVFFHPLMISLTLIEFIRHISFYRIWIKKQNEEKILVKLSKLYFQNSSLRANNKNVVIALENNTEDIQLKTAYQNQQGRSARLDLLYTFHFLPFFFSKLFVNMWFYEMRYESAGNIGTFWDNLGDFLGSLNSWLIKSRIDLKKIGDSYNRNIALRTFLGAQRNKFVRIDYNPHAHAMICKNLKIANSPLHVAKKNHYNVEQIVQDQLNKDSILEVDEMYFSPGVTLLHSKNNQVNATFFKALNDQWIHMGGRTPKTQCQITMPCSKHEEILYLPKNTFLPLYRTLLEAIIYPRTLNSFQDKKSLLSKVETLMHQLDLSNLSKTLMTKKSTWDTITSRQLKRLLLIRAILFNPKVLCLGGFIDNTDEHAQVMINLLKEHLPDTVILISSTEPHKNLQNTTTAYVHNKLLSFSKPCLDNTTHHATFLDKTLWNSKVDFSGRKLKATP